MEKLIVISSILILVGCAKSDEQVMLDNCCNQGAASTLLGGAQLIVPNAFTPNGDGINDTLIIVGLEAFNTNKLVLNDASGKNVLTLIDYENNWTGGGVSAGTYSFTLTADADELTGSICLIRASTGACVESCVTSSGESDPLLDC